MTAHEDPDHGIKHCHHPYVQTNCHACWNALTNAEFTARMHREEIIEQVDYAENLQRWAQGKRISDIPREFDRLEAQRATSESLEREIADLRRALDQAMAGLREAVSRLPKRRRGGFERFA
jgi:hypothetical protein